MSTQDDIDRLKAEEDKAKGRLGYVETQYRELRDGSRAGQSASELEARDLEAGQLTSARTNLEITINTREAERHELERGRDAADKQAGVPQRPADGEEVPPPPPAPAGQAPRPLDASLDAPGIDPSLGPQLQQQTPSQSGPVPDGTGGGPSPVSADAAQPGRTPPEKALESNLPPFEPPAPEGYFIGRSRERNDRFFKPIDDVERIKAEQDLCERYKAEVTDHEKEIAYQRERAAEEMKKLGLDQAGIDEFRKNEFEREKDQLTRLHQDQKQQLHEVHSLTQVADETMRAEQAQKREASERALDNHWYDATYRVCEGPAKTAVAGQYGADLAAYNARLDREGASPDQKIIKLDEFGSRLMTHAPADIQMTTTLLQEQSFPEIVANGPQFHVGAPPIDPPAPPGPPPPGESVPALPPPQQTGPQGPSF